MRPDGSLFASGVIWGSSEGGCRVDGGDWGRFSRPVRRGLVLGRPGLARVWLEGEGAGRWWPSVWAGLDGLRGELESLREMGSGWVWLGCAVSAGLFLLEQAEAVQ